jgi:YtkA-like
MKKYLLWALGGIVLVVTAVVLWPRGEPQPYLAESAQLSFRLTPASTKTGINSFDLRVTDRAGNPAQGDVTVEPVMPQMGHAVSPITAPPREPGHYMVENVDLAMAGQWEIAVSIDSERVVFPLLLT